MSSSMCHHPLALVPSVAEDVPVVQGLVYLLRHQHNRRLASVVLGDLLSPGCLSQSQNPRWFQNPKWQTLDLDLATPRRWVEVEHAAVLEPEETMAAAPTAAAATLSSVGSTPHS